MKKKPLDPVSSPQKSVFSALTSAKKILTGKVEFDSERQKYA